MGGHTYSDCLFHIVFSTKERRTFPLDQMQHLQRYMVGIAKKNDCKVIVAGGIGDHVHLLMTLPTTVPMAKAVQALKGGPSKWFNAQNAQAGFAWQEGFAAFTVSRSQIDTIANYIRNQEQHHAKRDFAAEFLALLKKHGIETTFGTFWVESSLRDSRV